MSKALAWMRMSKGSDDDIGLEDQHELVHGLANEFDPDHDTSKQSLMRPSMNSSRHTYSGVGPTMPCWSSCSLIIRPSSSI